jgi:hypothetical protein
MRIRFAGLDWASQTPCTCVSDDSGAVDLQFEINHDAPGLAELCRRAQLKQVFDAMREPIMPSDPAMRPIGFVRPDEKEKDISEEKGKARPDLTPRTFSAPRSGRQGGAEPFEAPRAHFLEANNSANPASIRPTDPGSGTAAA